MNAAVVLLVPLLTSVVLLIGCAGCRPFDAEAPATTTPDPEPRPGPEPDPEPDPPDPPVRPSYGEAIGAVGLGLLSRWRLSEAAGNVAYDTGPAGISGSYTGSPAVELGEPGGALSGREADVAARFPGTGGHVAIPFDPRLNVAADLRFTFEIWMRRRPADETAGQSRFLACAREFDGGDSRGWELFVTYEADGSIRVRGRTYTGTGTGHVEADVPVSAPGAAADAWHHVVASYDGAASTVAVHVHVVGVDGSFTQTVPVAAFAPSGTGTGLLIGAASRPFPADFFPGSLDEAAFYLRAFDVNTAKANFQAALP